LPGRPENHTKVERSAGRRIERSRCCTARYRPSSGWIGRQVRIFKPRRHHWARCRSAFPRKLRK